MNILPKKSWHVRSRRNIERVQRDEAEAEARAQVELERRLKVDQEVRLKDVRSKAGLEEPKHFNLFDIEPGSEHSSNQIDGQCQRRLIKARTTDEPINKSDYTGRLTNSEDITIPWYCKNDSFGLGSSSDVGPSKPVDKDLTLSKIYNKTSNRSIYSKPKPEHINSIYDPMIAMKQAEDMHRARRKKRQQDLAKLQLKNARSSVCERSNSKLDLPLTNNWPERNLKNDDSSSPEIIDIIPSSSRYSPSLQSNAKRLRNQ